MLQGLFLDGVLLLKEKRKKEESWWAVAMEISVTEKPLCQCMEQRHINQNSHEKHLHQVERQSALETHTPVSRNICAFCLIWFYRSLKLKKKTPSQSREMSTVHVPYFESVTAFSVFHFFLPFWEFQMSLKMPKKQWSEQSALPITHNIFFFFSNDRASFKLQDHGCSSRSL